MIWGSQRMKIVVEIPKEYEVEWAKDRFAESLDRLKSDAHCVAGNYERETAEMLVLAFMNARPCEDCQEFDCYGCKYK